MTKAPDADDLDPLGRGVPQAGIRIANERAVLTIIANMAGSSNADVARRSGLGPQTTSRIIADLEARDLVLRGPVLRGRRGQPATPLFLNPRGAYCFGVEIGWRQSQVTLVDLAGNVLASQRRAHAHPDGSGIMAEIIGQIAAIDAALTPWQRQRVIGIGVASPTPVARPVDMASVYAARPPLWEIDDIAARIAIETGLSTDWVNDGSAACWAEIIASPMPRPRGFAYFHIGTYIGAGIIAEGALWEGPTGNGANLGAIIVPDRDGIPNYMHRVASISAFEAGLRRAGITLPSGSPQDWDWSVLEPHASAWLDEAGRALAQAAKTTQAVVELDQISIDGIMPRPIVKRLLDRVLHHLQQLPVLLIGHPVIAIGSLGAFATAKGAALLPLHKRYFSQTWADFDA